MKKNTLEKKSLGKLPQNLGRCILENVGSVMLLKMHTRIGYSPTVNLEYLHLLARTLRGGNVFQRLMNYLRKKKT